MNYGIDLDNQFSTLGFGGSGHGYLWTTGSGGPGNDGGNGWSCRPFGTSRNEGVIA